MKNSREKFKTAFVAAYIFGVSGVVGVVGGKAIAEHFQSPIRTFVAHCASDDGALVLEAAAVGKTLVVTPVCRFVSPGQPAAHPAKSPRATTAATVMQI